jgi:restriction endonuclease S subunit
VLKFTDITVWPKKHLRDVCIIDPSKKETNGLDLNTKVSFGMMADLGEHRRVFSPKGVKVLHEVQKGGYSYFKTNDVLLAKMTPCFENGKSGIAQNLKSNIGFGSTEFYVIRPKGGLDPNLLYYYISSDKFINEGKFNLVGTTGRRRLLRQFVELFEIPIPPDEEQKHIVSLFQSIEKVIEHLDYQIQNLTSLKKQILRDLFSITPKIGNYLTKRDFEPVRFEKLALNISERVEPKETNLDTYVGLEHLDSDCLTIERTGKPEDVIGTKLKIYKGDIIFGKRRAYLRKVAVSHFDGIASAHSMILRANVHNIEKDFLPYFMQSDTFMERAVQISEGSLSPTIKWKTLAAQEFVLPKKEKQSIIIEIFKQFDNTTNLIQKQISTLRTLKQNLLNEILG